MTTAERQHYNFYLDAKYGWIVRDHVGQDRVMDRDTWFKLFGISEWEDRFYFLSTYLEPSTYGRIRAELEFTVKDGYITKVNLCAPDGDILKENLTAFHVDVKPFL